MDGGNLLFSRSLLFPTNLESGPIQVSFGPVIGPINPGSFRHVLPEKRQIVRPTREITASCRDLAYLMGA